MTEEKNKKTSVLKSLWLNIIVLIVFSVGFIPFVVFLSIIFLFVDFTHIFSFLLLPILTSAGIAIIVYYLIILTGLIIHIFKIRYNPGEYDYDMKDSNSFRWMIICALYTPIRKMIEIIPVGRMKNTYLRYLGMKIGKNTLVGGVIKDPCLTEIGDNCTMGEYAVIYCHIHNMKKQKITMEKVIIGNNVVIGAGAIIMPGVVVEDNVSIAAGALVKKGEFLRRNSTYAGVPAKKIKNSKNLIKI